MLARLTTGESVGIVANMGARLVDRSKQRFSDGMIAEYVIWEVPEPVPGSAHPFKYRLFFGKPGNRVIGYDNERGKGDHKHVGDKEEPYHFTSPDQLIADFRREIARYGATRTDNDDQAELG